MNAKSLIIKLLVFISVILSPVVLAQENDFGSWISFEVEKSLSPKFNLIFKEEVRISDDFSEFNRLSTGLSLSYKINDFLEAGTGYAWLYKHDSEDRHYENQHRITLYLQGKIQINNLTVSWREYLQNTWYESSRSPGYNPKLYLRSRLKLDYKLNKFKPYASIEIFQRLNHPEEKEFDEVRYSLGTSFPVSEKLKMTTFINLNQDVNQDENNKEYILGIGLNYNL